MIIQGLTIRKGWGGQMSLPLAFLVAKWRVGTAAQATYCPWSNCLPLTVFSITSETGLVKAARELQKAGWTKRKHLKPKAMTEGSPCEHLKRIRQKEDLNKTGFSITSENNQYHLPNNYKLSYLLGNLNTWSLILLPTASKELWLAPFYRTMKVRLTEIEVTGPICKTPNPHAHSTAPNAS